MELMQILLLETSLVNYTIRLKSGYPAERLILSLVGLLLQGGSTREEISFKDV